MKYKIWYEENTKLKKVFIESKSMYDLKYDENYPDNIIKIKELKKVDISKYIFIKNEKELVELFYEMSTMLEAKLSLDEVINILLNTKYCSKIHRILLSIKSSIHNGQSIYKSLESHKSYLGYLSILFFKLGEQNSNMSLSISSLHQILNESYNIKQKIKKALSYPMILVISLIISIGVIFNYIIPKFEYIFLQFGDDLPYSTYIMLNIKIFIDNYHLLILLCFFMFYIFLIVLYKKYKYYVDKVIVLYIPYFSNMYRYMILYEFFLSISLIVSSKFQFQDALIHSKDISSNLYIKSTLSNIIQDINNGLSISRSFEKTNLFDSVAIRLLLTAQKTNKMEIILNDIQKIYKKKLSSNITLFTKFLEPFLVLLISLIVLWLVLAIMTPVWELSNVIN